MANVFLLVLVFVWVVVGVATTREGGKMKTNTV